MKASLVLGITLLAISCSNKTNPSSSISTEPSMAPESVTKKTIVPRDYSAKGYVAATVVDMSELDGCGYMLKLDSGKKLQPASALSEQFAVNKLRVWIKYQLKKGAVGICMSGQIVTITSIAKQ